MTTRVLTEEEIEAVCDRLSYIATKNARGLGNGTGAIIFDQWTHNSVCVHSYIPEPRFLTKGFLSDMFRYAFTNVDWIIGVTPADNAKALAFNERLGFTVRDRLPDGFAKGIDTVIQVMFYTDCRWWKRPQIHGHRPPNCERILTQVAL
jgi:hypothetical protein